MKKILLAGILLALGWSGSLRADTVVVFNEIMYHPATNETELEWVELYNQMAVDVDISDWSLAGAADYTFPSNSIVPGRGYLLVAISPATLFTLTGLPNIYGPFTGRLGNNGDHLELRNNSGRVMDELTYGVEGDWPVAPDGSGVSLAKIDPEQASPPPENWTFSTQVGGTPGAENFPRTDLFIPPPGLVSYWKFDELGSQAIDEAGQNYGTLGSGVSRVDGSLSFNGTTNAFVNLGPGTAQGSFAATTGLTIEMVLTPGWDGNTTVVLFAKAPGRPGNYRDTVLANGPLAYWRLDDATTTIRDATANARNGTASAGVLLSQAGLVPTDPSNTSARFGNTDRIIIPGFEKIGAAGYTVEFWVKPNALPTGCCQNLVGDGEASGDYFMMNYILGPAQGLQGAIRPHYGPANSPVSMDSPTALQVGNVYHVVTTWDVSASADNAVIYLNGVANRTGTITRNVPAAGTTGANRVYIGKDDRDTTDGNHFIDEVALYNYPLTAADVAAHYFAGTATNFDLNLGNAIQLAFQNDGNNAQANPPVPPGPVLSFGLVVNGLYSELDMPLDGQDGRPTLAALQSGAHHLAATYDSATGLKAIFVDGVMCFSTTLGGLISAANNANAIAGNSAAQGTTPYTGKMDDLAYWGRALSTSELEAHVGSVQAGYDYFTPTSRVDVSYLAFNEVSSSTNSDFWCELINYGTNRVVLDGFSIYYDGTTNAAYVFPPGQSLEVGGLLSIASSTLGFHPTSGDKLYLFSPTHSNVLDAVVAKKRPRGRSPDATGRWLIPDPVTPGASNQFALRTEVVINEIMYHHRIIPPTNNYPAQESPEAWIELFNRSSNTVDLTGWEIDGGVQYRFLAGRTLGPGAYLLVADDAAYLRSIYPTLDIVGNLNGRLSHRGDLVELKDPVDNPADEVRYHDNGPWPEYADGGGSSLELRDPAADNTKAEAWAASDETGKTSWQTYSYRMVADVPSGSGQPSQWNDFIFGLLSAGECLIDDIRVIESPTNNPVEMVANGNFETGITGWRVLGTHGRSRVEVDPDNPGNHVLHLSASGPQEHMHNHIETTYINSRAVVNSRLYEVSFRARWLAGNNLLNTRLYFNRVAHTTTLPMPSLSGTPGVRNSRYEPNIGPTFSEFQHRAVVPKPGESVTVSVVGHDPQGVASARVFWSVNSGAWNSAALSSAGGGRYTGIIPGQNSGAVVQFYVQATDGSGAAATFPARGPNSGALYKVEDGQANLALAHNVRIVMTPANIDLLHGTAQGVNQTNVMSNDLLPCTVVYDEQRAYYDCGVHLRGSQRGRYSDTRTGFHINFPSDDLFAGVHPVMLIDRSGAGDATANRQEEIVLKHMLNRAGGIPGTYSEICRVLAPRSAHTGPAQWWPRHEDLFVETAFENGGDGTMFEMELIYYPTSTNQFGYKNPQPDGVVGTDFTDLGNDKEIYRYNFMIKNHRDADDYSQFIAFCKAMSLSGTALQAQTEQILDIDQWMRAYAFVSLCSVGDMYTYGNNHNWFMYLRPADGKLLYFPWDMDFVFTRGSSGALVGDQNMGKLVSLTPNLRRLYGHMLDIINISFNSSYMAYWTDHYDNFAPGQSYSGTLNNIGARATFVRNTINGAGGNAPFAVNGGDVISTSNNLVTFTGTGPVQIKTIKVNGSSYPVTWTTLNQWRMSLPVAAATNELTFMGYDVHDQPLSNFTRTVTVNYTGPAPDPTGAIVFNEIMYNPAYPGAAYVELFNTSPNLSFDLSGWRVQGLDYTFPLGSIMTNGQYLVLAKDTSLYRAAYGTDVPAPFDQFDGSLQLDGETLTLLRPGENGEPEIEMDKVRYETEPPWKTNANGNGASLQLIDPEQDNSRASNWSDGTGWRFFRRSSTVGSLANRVILALAQAGDLYIDDIELVRGSEPGSGPNVLQNGDFESGSLSPWTWVKNHSNTVVTAEVAYSGSYSLHIIATGPGSTADYIQQSFALLDSASIYTLSFYYLPTTPNYLKYRVGTGLLDFQVGINVSPPIFTPGTINGSAGVLPPYDPVWLNELVADNTGGFVDGQGQSDPWIELHNTGPDPISLNGYLLANNYDSNLTEWAFPADTTINPGTFKIVWMDGEPGQTVGDELHASFRLHSATGSVALVRLLDGTPQITDYLNYVGLGTNQAYGDFPDGQPFKRVVLALPTPGTNNIAKPAEIFINEWMADNLSHLADPADDNYEDWFELYNAGTDSVDLTGYFLTDNLNNKTRYTIPVGYVIQPGGFLLVWADNDPEQSTNTAQLHVNFALNNAGESIGLYSPQRVVIDEVTFGVQTNDISEGRYPDGSATLAQMSVPTPGRPNVLSGENNAPLLAPIEDATIVLGQTLNILLTASDVEVPAQFLTFSLLPGAPEGAVITSTGLDSAQFSWQPIPAQAPGTYPITVRVTDSGALPLSDEDSFTVTVLLPPQIGISAFEGQVTLSFPTIPGRTYRVLYADTLAAPIDWQPLGNDQVATGLALIIQDTVGARTQRFYQVQQVD